MRRAFVNTEMQRDFEDKGYVLIPNFLNSDEIRSLRQRYFDLENDLGKGFHATMHSHNVDYRRAVTDGISQVFTPKVSGILDDYRPLGL